MSRPSIDIPRPILKSHQSQPQLLPRSDSTSSAPTTAKLEDLLNSLSTAEFSADRHSANSTLSDNSDNDSLTLFAAKSNKTQRESRETTASAIMCDTPKSIGEDAALSLGVLQGSMATISGHLFKLGGSDEASGATWKQFFFVLSENGTLYAFQSASNPSAIPFASLPISSCTGGFQESTSSWILQLHSDDGAKRSWTLKCTDEDTMSLWLRSVSRTVSAKPQPQAPGAASVFQFPRRTSSVARAAVQQTADADSLRSPSDEHRPARSPSQTRSAAMQRAHSAASINQEEREAEQRARYQEYLLLQRQNAEKYKHEQRLRKEAEDRARAEAERARLEAELAKVEAERQAHLQYMRQREELEKESQKLKLEAEAKKKLEQEKWNALKKIAPAKIQGPMMSSPGMGGMFMR